MAPITAKHIQIVRSSKAWLNSMSQASSDAIVSVLSKHYETVGVTIVNDQSDLETLTALQPDLVVLGMKFVPTEPALGRDSPRIWLAEHLDNQGIAYTGSNQHAHMLELDKSLAKQRVLDAGLKTAPFYVATNEQQAAQDLGFTFPLFVKPTDRGGGLGIDSDSVVVNSEALHKKVQSIAGKLGANALVEEYLSGREFSVAILRNENSEELSAMPIELVPPTDGRGQQLLSNAVKRANSETAIAVTDLSIGLQVTALALNVFEALGARDYGRIDIRLDGNGVPHFLEANLIPSLIDGYGSFPKACMLHANLEYEQMLLRLVRLGLERQAMSPLLYYAHGESTSTKLYAT